MIYSIVYIAKKKRVHKRKRGNRCQSFIATPDTTEKDSKRIKNLEETESNIFYFKIN